jgi:dTDP-4-dehydrorhamnose 3,5-epimerase
MRLTGCGLADAWVVEFEPARDERGAFTALWEPEAFGARGLFTTIDQASHAENLRAGTLRGMHFQLAPFQQAKLVGCVTGAIFDVMIDLRPDSQTFKHWFGLELAAGDARAAYVPAGFAHGYLTLRDDTTVHYLIAGKYSPAHARGVRWNDPAFAIRWPATPVAIAPRDANYADFAP